jgi:Flp pilus assembly protein TadG
VTSTDRGSVAVEFTLIAPLFLFAVLMVVQVALWHLAGNVALAAARDAARVARADTGTSGQAQVAGQRYLSHLGAGLISAGQVEVTRGLDTATVTVTGQAVDLLPGWRWNVTARSAGPVERFRRG